MSNENQVSEAERISLQKYRSELIVADKQSQDSYDKSIVALSGGALGLSLVFIKDIVGEDLIQKSWAAVSAWSFWAASIALVVISFATSAHALRTAIDQVDSGSDEGNVGGGWSTATSICNTLAGVCLVLGIISFILFASANIGDSVMAKKGEGSGHRGKVTETPTSPRGQNPPVVDGYVPPKRPPTNPKPPSSNKGNGG